MASTKTTDDVIEDGAHEAAPPYHLDPERRVFVTSSGVELKLRVINNFMMERYGAKLNKSKPTIPVQEVDHGKGRISKEANPNDPIYREALEVWERNQGVLMMQFIVNVGVKNDPPKDTGETFAAYAAYFDDDEMTPAMRKYFWVMSLLNTGDDETTALLEAISGQGLVTQGGMADAASSFRRNGQSE